MLATSCRVRPCIPRARRPSSLRSTFRVEPSILIVTSGGSARSSLPLGPSTRTRPSATCTFVPCGIATGALPIRDMRLLPHGADDLAADVFTPRDAFDHDPSRGREDIDAEPLANVGDVLRADVDAE